METFLWVEKYRPKSISECILPEDLKNTFSEFVKDKHIPNLILCGSAGRPTVIIKPSVLNQENSSLIFLFEETVSKI